MDVVNIKGEKLGYIKDIIIDFNKKNIIGFKVTPYKLLKKNFNVMKEDILYFDKSMVINKINNEEYLKFSDIKKLYVIDKNSNILGMVKDLVFSEKDLEIKALIIARNSISLLTERKVLLIKNMILGEKNILYFNNDDKYELFCIPNINMMVIGEK